MKILSYLSIVCLFGGIIVCTIYGYNCNSRINDLENEKEFVVTEIATEIEALENVQKQQNEQIQLSTTIQQLSSILQSTELGNKELADALGEIVIENGLLKIDLRRLNILISGLLRENAILKRQLKNKST